MSTEIQLYLKKLFATLCVALFLYGIYMIRDLMVILFFSSFLALLITPLVEKAKKFKIPEWITILCVFFIIIILASVIIGTIIPIIIQYVVQLVNSISLGSSRALAIYHESGIQGFHFHPYIESILIQLSAGINIESILTLVRENAGSIQAFITKQIGTVTNNGISLVGSIGGTITNWFI